jgi:pyridoxal phosphate enzyme (YggS family)
MIGALQTNKCRPLAESIPNLFSVSSVDTAKKADALEKGRAKLVAERAEEVQGRKLRVLVQINTSGETEKSGVEPGTAAVDLCTHILHSCPHLQLGGLMTIGAIARSKATTAETENEDFDTLRKCRDEVAEKLGLEKEKLELSMGMSSDFEAAIRQGSTEVRVGTTIFGERPARGDAKVKEDTSEEKK